MGPPSGKRVAFRREVRRTHADRWLDGLRQSKSSEYRRFRKSFKDNCRGSWRKQAVNLMAESIGNGYPRTKRKYAQRHYQASAAFKRNYATYRKMGIRAWLNGKKRKQRDKCRRLIQAAKIAKREYGQVQTLSGFFT